MMTERATGAGPDGLLRTFAGGPEVRAAAEQDVDLALSGDARAVERVVSHAQDDVYNLAVRMLWCPEDAADATQEILMKVVTHLATFRRQSSFRTWVYRIATNHLKNIRRSRVEKEDLSFEEFSKELKNGLRLAGPSAREPDQALLLEEVKIGCTQAMLLCLDRPTRMAYILGAILEFSGDESAHILGTTPAAFRQRLSRAREKIQNFMRGQCGLVNPQAPCRCDRRLDAALANGTVQPTNLQFAGKGHVPAAEMVKAIEAVDRVSGIYRAHPRYGTPSSVADRIRTALAAM